MNFAHIRHWFFCVLVLVCLAAPLAEAQSRTPPPKKPATQTNQQEANLEKAASSFEAGQALHQRGELEKAVGFYEQALKLDPALWQAEYQLAQAQLALQRIPAAREAITKVIETLQANSSVPELKPYLARAQTLRGEIALSETQFADASTAFRAAIEINAQNARAYAGLAEVAMREKNAAEAIRSAQSALENGDNTTATLALMGEALLVTGKAKDAVVYFSKVLEQEPKRAEILRARASAYTQSGEIPKAIQDLNASLSLENNLADSLRLAELYTRTKAFAEATEAYQQVLKDDPENNEARTALAVLLIDSGKSQEAIASLEELLKASPERADIRAQLAALYMPTSPDDALKQYLAAAKLKPEKLSYQLGAGSALVKLKRFPEAVELLRRLIAQNPEGETAYVAHTNLATSLFEMDDFANAAREFVWILNQQKERQRAAVTLYFLGICFDKLGDLEQAQKTYNQFLAIATPENQLEIDKVKLRLPALQRQLEKGQGKRKK